MAGGAVVVVLSGILVLPRARINKTSRSFEFRTDQHQSDYMDFTPSKKYNYKTTDIPIYCEFCGSVRKKSESFCSDCGREMSY